jgi:alcohol-forming fatty acyl-CoA reductase
MIISNSSTSYLPSSNEDSPIRDFYKDKVVFLTGGFGFIGKLLIEKLLKCDVKRIYVMARPKKGKCVTERLESLKNEPVSKYI